MFEKLHSMIFDNVCNKLKQIASVCAWTSIGVSALAGIVLFALPIFIDDFWWLMILGPLGAVILGIFSWISCLTIYGFGELIENTNTLNRIQADLHLFATQLREKEAAEKRAQDEAIKANAQKAELYHQTKTIHEKEETKTCATDEAEKSDAPKHTPSKNVDRGVITSTPSLKKQLSYALAFTTDSGMIAFLKTLKDERVTEILNSPPEEIRELTSKLLDSLKNPQ